MSDATAAPAAPTLEQATKVDAAYVAEWYKTAAMAGRLKATEAMMRRRIFDHYFPAPKEGSKDNKHPMGDGTGAVLQADHKVNRKVLEPELQALREAEAQPGSNAPKVPWDRLIKLTPELVKSEYNKLTEEERQYVDKALEIKPGTPELKVVIPQRG